MMMLPSIMDVAALAVTAFSPSKTCKVRVSSTRYRNDPYRARVLPRQTYAPAVAVAAPVLLKAAAAAPPAAAAATLLPADKMIAAALPAAVATPVEVSVKAPTAAAAPKQHFALVGFKHEAMMYQAPFRVAPGDVVIVEADRGEHIGVVQEVTTTVPKYNVPSRIVRRANAAEADVMDSLKTKESSASKAIQKLSESLGLGIKIVDTEFQMDSNKLTVFFSSKVFVDFRKLQRSLFRDYRCRIWLVNWAEVRPYTPVPVNSVQ